MGIAHDSINSFYYLHLNNVYFLSGVPTSGALGTGAVSNGGQPAARPSVTVKGTDGSYQLITGAGALTYLPSGYSAWG